MSRRIAVAVLLTLVLATPVLAGTGDLDQVFEPDTTDAETYTGIRTEPTLTVDGAQTVTVGMTGILSCVEVFVRRMAAAPGPLVLEVQSVAGGEPGGVVLASASVPAAGIPTSLTWVAFDLTGASLHVTAGESLALVLRSEELATNQGPWYGWEGEYNANATYAGGHLFTRLDGGAWNPFPLHDAGFRTYVTAPVPVETTTWGAVKSGFAGP